jgi:hypothetical protein
LKDTREAEIRLFLGVLSRMKQGNFDGIENYLTEVQMVTKTMEKFIRFPFF